MCDLEVKKVVCLLCWCGVVEFWDSCFYWMCNCIFVEVFFLFLENNKFLCCGFWGNWRCGYYLGLIYGFCVYVWIIYCEGFVCLYVVFVVGN